MPRFLWLATGGKSQINDRLLVLKGRTVVAFPDIDGYDEWERKLADYSDLDIRISPVLQQNSTKADREAHIDIADWLLRSLCVMPGSGASVMPGSDRESLSGRCEAFLKAAEFISPEHHVEVEALIHDLELEFWGAVKVEEHPP